MKMSGTPMGLVLPILSMILKDKNSAKEVEAGCSAAMDTQGKTLLVEQCKFLLHGSPFSKKMDFAF